MHESLPSTYENTGIASSVIALLEKRGQGIDLALVGSDKGNRAHVERVIGELRQSFDWVLCDSPAGIERGAAALDQPARRVDLVGSVNGGGPRLKLRSSGGDVSVHSR